MNPKELRIGNFYAISTSEGIVYRQVKEIVKNEFGQYSSKGDNLELAAKPISLYWVWLKKCGFKDLTGGWGGAQGSEWEFELNGIKIYSREDGWYISGFEKVKIKFFHQLQNFWHSLTGEELNPYKVKV